MITTPLLQYSILFFSIPLFLSSINALNPDGITLLSFKHSLLSNHPSLLQTWNQSDLTPCSWSGVTCSPYNGPVTGLSLPNSRLSGSIPTVLARLQHLRVLDLSYNSLNGTLPINISSLQSLRVLNVSHNYLSGNIPSGFDSINILDLSSNSFSGALPLKFGGVNLNYLNLSNNIILGSVLPEFALQIPVNAVIDLSYNNFTGEIPQTLSNKKLECFLGNLDLCGKPLTKLCTVPSTHSLPPNVTLDSSATPAIAAIPKYVGESSNKESGGINSWKIVAIVVGDVAAIVILVVVFFHAYQFRKKKKANQNPKEFAAVGFDESRACSCFGAGNEEESSETETLSESIDNQTNGVEENKCLVMVDGETKLEMETLLKAPAYILGSSGGSIVYKVVVGGDAGVAFAVRRLAECGVERMKEFEKIVRGLGKLRHRNLVKVRGFYWGEEEKLVIYDYVSGGSLAGVAYEKLGLSSCQILSFEVRLKIAKGIAKGLSYIHDKKHVHGNMKPSNILLTSEMDPVISDFGLEWLITGKTNYSFDKSHDDLVISRNHYHHQRHHHYQAPESMKTSKSNPKWDVYAFGIILLELFSGKVFSDREFAMWNTDLTIADMETKILTLMDKFVTSMDVHGRKDSILTCFKLGIMCASLVPHKRPSMKEALQVLEKIPCPS